MFASTKHATENNESLVPEQKVRVEGDATSLPALHAVTLLRLRTRLVGMATLHARVPAGMKPDLAHGEPAAELIDQNGQTGVEFGVTPAMAEVLV